MNQQFPDVMIDLETLGKKAGCIVAAIGVVAFDLRTGTIGETFYRSINMGDASKYGLTADPGTVAWWLGQPVEAQRALITSTYPMHDALTELVAWLDRHTAPADQRRVWGNSPAFDCVILGHVFDAAGIDRPWRYYYERDFRTLCAMYPHVERSESDVGVHHNALDDAMHQVQHLMKIRDAHIASQQPRAA